MRRCGEYRYEHTGHYDGDGSRQFAPILALLGCIAGDCVDR
jgi:hypothetical protein